MKRLSVRGRYGVHCTVGAEDATYVGDRVSSFAEVSVAIGVALIVAVVWPEKEATPSGEKVS